MTSPMTSRLVRARRRTAAARSGCGSSPRDADPGVIWFIHPAVTGLSHWRNPSSLGARARSKRRSQNRTVSGMIPEANWTIVMYWPHDDSVVKATPPPRARRFGQRRYGQQRFGQRRFATSRHRTGRSLSSRRGGLRRIYAINPPTLYLSVQLCDLSVIVAM